MISIAVMGYFLAKAVSPSDHRWLSVWMGGGCFLLFLWGGLQTSASLGMRLTRAVKEGDSADGEAAGRSQVALLDLLLWTTVIASVFGFWRVSDFEAARKTLRLYGSQWIQTWIMFGAVYGVSLAALGIGAVWLLVRGAARWAGVLLIVVSAWGGYQLQRLSGPDEAEQHWLLLLYGFAAAGFGLLCGVLRLRGYRYACRAGSKRSPAIVLGFQAGAIGGLFISKLWCPFPFAKPLDEMTAEAWLAFVVLVLSMGAIAIWSVSQKRNSRSTLIILGVSFAVSALAFILQSFLIG